MKNVIIVVLMLTAASMSAQRRTANLNEPPEVVSKPRSGHGIGVVISSTMGNGLAYRYWNGRLGYHTAFFPQVNNDSRYVSWGNAVYYTVREVNRTSKFIIHAGLDYVNRRQLEYDLYTPAAYRTTNSFNFGIAPGVEIHTRSSSLTCCLGYGSYNRFNSNGDVVDRLVTLTGCVSYFFEL